MDIKNFVLSYYKNSAQDFHIQKVEKVVDAQKPHTHDYFQIYYIAKGSLTHYLGNSSSHLSHGDMFIIPPNTTHHIIPYPDTVFYSFSFMSDFLGEQTKANRLALNFLRIIQSSDEKKIRAKISLNSENILYIESIMEHILDEFEEKPHGYDETIRAYSIILITMLERAYLDTVEHELPNYFESNKQYVLHCIEYIQNNFADDLSLEEMSKRSTLSKSSFCTIFYNLTGKSFNNYLNMCRIKKATEYIKKGYKITAVYGLCGYNDFSTFYRNFKKIMGVSPKEYKKERQK